MESREQQESGFVGGVTTGLPVATGCCGEPGTDADAGCCGEPGARVDAAGLDAQRGSTPRAAGSGCCGAPVLLTEAVAGIGEGVAGKCC